MPGSGYKVSFYQSGTTTPVTVYTSAAVDTPLTQPIVCDASGVFPQVFSTGGAIKAVVQKPDNSVFYTLDPVFRVPTSASGAIDVTFSPTGPLPFTNVQAAIEGSVAAAASGFNAFGLGITGNATLLANLDATNIGAGAYRFDGTTTGTYPVGVAAGDTGLIETWRQAAGTAMMELYHATTNRRFRRRLTAGVWGAWREVVEVNTGAVQGDIIVRGVSDWERLPLVGVQGRILLASKTASASATLDFTEFNNAVYRYYEFELEYVKPATNAVDLAMRFSSNGGSTYDAGGTDYSWSALAANSAAPNAQAVQGTATALNLCYGGHLSNAGADQGMTGTVRLYGAANTGNGTRHISTLSTDGTVNLNTLFHTQGKRRLDQDTDALRFFMSSGNIASGVIRMYGLV
jgi:hypothetical protein